MSGFFCKVSPFPPFQTVLSVRKSLRAPQTKEWEGTVHPRFPSHVLIYSITYLLSVWTKFCMLYVSAHRFSLNHRELFPLAAVDL